ncbi:MAG: membrane integrity-associated transporter subunit PqiC [Gammaproteobacteria bacterium]
MKCVSRASLCVVVGILFAACAGQPASPPRWLVLAPLAPVATTPMTGDPAVIVGPVDLPAYTDRASLFVLHADTELRALPDARWAEPLARNVSRVLVENLSRVLGSGEVTTLGGAARPDSLQVAVEITEFVTTEEGAAELTAVWRVLGDGGRAVLASGKIRHVDPGTGREHAAHAAALSRALAALSHEIGAALRALPPGVRGSRAER